MAQCRTSLEKYLDRQDVWAAACVLYEAGRGKLLFACLNELDLAARMKKLLGNEVFKAFPDAASSIIRRARDFKGEAGSIVPPSGVTISNMLFSRFFLKFPLGLETCEFL